MNIANPSNHRRALETALLAFGWAFARRELEPEAYELAHQRVLDLAVADTEEAQAADKRATLDRLSAEVRQHEANAEFLRSRDQASAGRRR